MENTKSVQKKNNLLTKESSSYMSLKHMKSLIVLVVGLLTVGCATMKDVCVQLGISKPNTPEQKQKTLRDSVVGEYEFKADGVTGKQVYLENGIREWYENGKKQTEGKWSIVNGEIHVEYGSGTIDVHRINPDKSITLIADIFGGKRGDWSKENQWTSKKIK